MTEETTQQPILVEPITEPGSPSLSAAYTLPDIAEWLAQELKSMVAQHDQDTLLMEVSATPTDAEMALAIYEDWKARMGEGQGC